MGAQVPKPTRVPMRTHRPNGTPTQSRKFLLFSSSFRFVIYLDNSAAFCDDLCRTFHSPGGNDTSPIIYVHIIHIIYPIHLASSDVSSGIVLGVFERAYMRTPESRCLVELNESEQLVCG